MALRALKAYPKGRDCEKRAAGSRENLVLNLPTAYSQQTIGNFRVFRSRFNMARMLMTKVGSLAHWVEHEIKSLLYDHFFAHDEPLD